MKAKHTDRRNAHSVLAAAWTAATVLVLSAGTALADVEGGLSFYRSPIEARTAALAQGKALFVLSGADWCGYCDIVKDYLAGLGATFSDRYVLYYCDIDSDASGMAAASPQYGVFDPAEFKPASGWSQSNGMLAYDLGGSEVWVRNVLDAGWTAWQERCSATDNVYTVEFYANGGKSPTDGKMAAQTMAAGKAAKLRKNAFARNGYVFAGWATSKGAARKGVVAYRDAQKVKDVGIAGKTTILYAVWAKPAYKVKFCANGGKGQMDVLQMTYGKSKKLSANKFKRNGYAFKGWATSKSAAKKGKIKYKNKKSVKNLTMTGKTVKLYAVWKKK